MAIIKLNATVGLTGDLPAVSGANLIGVSAGKVLQSVTASDQTARSTTSTSLVTASNTLTVNITPSSNSSKVFVIAHFNCYQDNSNTNTYYTIYRDSTNLGNGLNGMALHKPQYTTTYNTASHNACIQVLDSPNTSSQINYQIYLATSGGGTAHINYHSGKSIITAFEVAN